MSDERLPANLEAERSVLGAILLHADVFAEAKVRPGDFFRDAHRFIFEAMCQLHNADVPIEFLTVSDRLSRSGRLDAVGGPAYIASLVDGVPRSVNIEHYARIVKELSRVRQIDAITRGAVRRLTTDPSSLGNGVGSKLAAQIHAIVGEAHQTAGDNPIAVSLPALMEQIADQPGRESCLGELLAIGEIAMLHGQPRDGKTWVSLEFAIAVALGDVAFSLSRLRASVARPVLIVSNEDSKGAYIERLRLLLVGRGLLDAPADIHLLVGEGCNLDDAGWQQRFVSEVVRIGAKLVILDPVRSVTGCADQGPRELQPFAAFLRRLVRETGAALLLVHHDTKPSAGPVQDQRRRAQRASGGAIFSVVDSPISVERVDEQRSLLAPDGYKHSVDPAPFIVARVSDGLGMRLVATETGATKSADDLALREKVRAFLKDNPFASGNTIVSGVHAKRETVLRLLEAMLETDEVDAVDGPRKSRRWCLR